VTSPVLLVLSGYAVVTDFSQPIIGEGSNEPNDTFIKQIRDNSVSAVRCLRELGVSDHRVAVAGHSYGGFMTANLLAHNLYETPNGPENLFLAGIARSGAYNRSLTPFGFQGEERTFWEAKETYHSMSPFEKADKIKAPLLLIAGEEDTNVGTWPVQSVRLFQALQGTGGRSRLVMLPHEGHAYVSRESALHVLYEMEAWLDKYVRNAEPPSPCGQSRKVLNKEK